MEKRPTPIISLNSYQAPQPSLWKGRIDGNESEHWRWHQWIKCCDLSSDLPPVGSLVILGFAVDEGVARNQGVVGASQTPSLLRGLASNLPVHTQNLSLYDVGDVICVEGSLEKAQECLAEIIFCLLTQGCKPIVIGGGHEVTYGHQEGIRRYLRLQNRPASLGMINLDAHFDNRIPGPSGPSSGTGFWQAERDCIALSEPFNYMAIGIQEISNTKALFESAQQNKTQIYTGNDWHQTTSPLLIQQIDTFLSSCDGLYLTLDMDVFHVSFAPGVSAPNPVGLFPDRQWRKIWNHLVQHPKLLSLDIAEINPSRDPEQKTQRLALGMLYEWAQQVKY
jgi:formiminoglutamase